MKAEEYIFLFRTHLKNTKTTVILHPDVVYRDEEPENSIRFFAALSIKTSKACSE